MSLLPVCGLLCGCSTAVMGVTGAILFVGINPVTVLGDFDIKAGELSVY